MNIFFTILFFILGASVGSFITVLIHRTRHYEKGLIMGRSRCVNCKKNLGPIDLIPILSFLFLGGKCRKCNKSINSSYLIIELFTASVFAFLYSQFPFVLGDSVHGAFNGIIEYGLLLQLLYYLLIASGLIVIFFYDLLYKEIPDMFSLPLIAVAVVGGLITGSPDIVSMLTGAAIGLAFFGGQFLISKGKWLGSGDIRLGVFMGIFLGWQLMLVGLFISYILGAIISVALLLSKKVTGKSEVAFGPFLIAGTVIAQVYGMEILNWYFSFTSV